MFKPKEILVSLILFLLGIVSVSTGNADIVQAATVAPTPTATRVLHVIVKARSTPTPTSTATATVNSPNLGSSIQATVQAYIAQSSDQPSNLVLTPTTEMRVAQPVRLMIPGLQVDANIEAVGRDKSGAMKTPGRVENVAWYELGSAPGEIGNAVIAGHLDRADGSPAVFWGIGTLKIGDEVIVRNRQGVEYHFQVTQSRRYPFNQAPVEDIFGFSLKSQLNLITCTGTWDRKSRNYSSRLVVSAALVKTVRTSN